MLTLRTSAHILTQRHCRGFHLIRTSTGALRPRTPGRPLCQECTRLRDAELRRLWLDHQWSAHIERLQSRQSRRQR